METKDNVLVDGKPVSLYTIVNANGMSCDITNYGAKIIRLFAPDRNNNFADVVLAFDTLDEIIEKEELVDDLELVAVITAAIAASMEVTADASEEKVSVGGFVVRSIKRANTNNWQKA